MRPIPKFSIIVPSLGKSEYLRLFLSSLEQTGKHEYEVICHVYPRNLPIVGLYYFPLAITTDDTPGMGYASNRCLSRASGEWIIWLNDDMLFLPGWDDFVGRLRQDRVLCWDLLEPIQGSFPPPCYAGNEPSEFNPILAREAARERNRSAAEPGGFFGTFIFHRSLLTPNIRWSEDTGAYSTADIDLPYRLFVEHRHIVFGRLGTHLYHFTHGSIRDHPELRMDGDEAQGLFRRNFGITTGEAYNRIEERSMREWMD